MEGWPVTWEQTRNSLDSIAQHADPCGHLDLRPMMLSGVAGLPPSLQPAYEPENAAARHLLNRPFTNPIPVIRPFCVMP